MFKHLFIQSLLLLVINNFIFSQTGNVGIGTLTPDPSAILDLSSTNKALRLTRVTNTASISNPVNGLLVFSTSDQKLYYYDGSTWRDLLPTEMDPKVNSTVISTIPRWNGTSLVDGIIRDNGGDIGIGTMPVANQKLTVNGKTTTSSFQLPSGAFDGGIMRSDALGNAVWMSPSSLPPIQENDPQVNIFNTNLIPRNSGSVLVDGTIWDDGNKIVIGSDFFSNAKLSVTGLTKTNTFQMTDGASINNILKSDAQGNASWVNASSVEVDPQVNIPTHLIGSVPNWDGTALVNGILYDNGTTVQVNGDSGSNVPPSLNVIGTAQFSTLKLPYGASAGALLQSVDDLGHANWVDRMSIQTLEIDPQVLCSFQYKVPRFNGSELVDGSINDYGSSVEIGTYLTPNQFFKVYGESETNTLRIINGAINGHILTSNAFGNASWVAPSTVENDPQVSNVITHSIPRWNGTTLADGVIRDDATNIGIGTAPVPNQKLTVSGKTTTSDLQMITGAGSNKILRSDSDGNATWVTSSSVETDPQVSMTNLNYIPVWNGTTLVDGILGQSSNGDEVIVGGNLFADTLASSNIKMLVGAGNGKILQSDANGNGNWVNSTTLTITETDPQVSSSSNNSVPRWNGISLADGTIQDDATNIGIGTAPVSGQKLTVSGKTTTTNLQMTNSAANGLVLQSDASGNGTWVNTNTLTTNNLFNTSGSLTSARTLTQGNNALSIANNGSQNTSINLTSTGDFAIQKNGTNVLMVNDNGKVGINTSNPIALLHVADSSVVFTGLATLPATQGNPPVSGPGIRMMWYPDKAAFRAGTVSGSHWDKSNVGDYSTAMGLSTTASGDRSTAMGDGNIASGNKSTAMGGSNTASGDVSTTMGGSNTASGLLSTAMGSTTFASGEVSTTMGSGSTASGFASTAMGSGSTASGNNSTAMGSVNIASAFASTAMGNGSRASGHTSTAMGRSTTASGNFSVAMGSETTASGNISTAMGDNIVSRAYASLALGRFNDSIIGSNKTSWITSDPVFIIGNGTSDINRSNAITILKNAKTGINTAAPLAGLHIKGIDATSDAHIRLEATSSTDYANILYDGNMKFRNFGAGDEFQWQNSANATNMTLSDNGNLNLLGKVTAFSLQMTTGASINRILQSDASGIGSWVNVNTLAVNNMYNTSGSLTSARTITQGSNAFTISNTGTQNTTVNLASTGDFDVQDNGISALKVLDDGSVGINQPSPLAGLHIKGKAASFDAHLRLESFGVSTDYGNILFDGNMKFRTFGTSSGYQWRNTANTTNMSLADNGDLNLVGNISTGSLTVKSLNAVSIFTDDQLVTVGTSSYLRLTSNSSTPSSRTILLSDGIAVGQMLFIECNETGTQGFEILDDAVNNNTNTSGTITMLAGDVIQFIWNGTDWLQISYSNN